MLHLIEEQGDPPAVHHLVCPIEQIGDRRVTNWSLFEKLRQVETEEVVDGQVELVFGVVE
ncbi:hypothetical protein D3C87_1374370 [compost metagenome]